MESYTEKRQHQRYKHKSPMRLYRMDSQDYDYYAEMDDFSRNGLSMMTNEKLVLGQIVYLEMKNHDSNTKGPEKNKSYSGIVKWGTYQSTDGDTNGRYKYGVEYSESYRYQ